MKIIFLGKREWTLFLLLIEVCSVAAVKSSSRTWHLCCSQCITGSQYLGIYGHFWHFESMPQVLWQNGCPGKYGQLQSNPILGGNHPPPLACQNSFCLLTFLLLFWTAENSHCKQSTEPSHPQHFLRLLLQFLRLWKSCWLAPYKRLQLRMVYNIFHHSYN